MPGELRRYLYFCAWPKEGGEKVLGEQVIAPERHRYHDPPTGWGPPEGDHSGVK